MGAQRIYNTPVTARDGVSLATDVYLPPAAAEGTPVRTIVARSPYNKNNAGYPKLAGSWNGHGYALVVGDVPGRGDAEGEFTPYVNEGEDGYDPGTTIGQYEYLRSLPEEKVAVCLLANRGDARVAYRGLCACTSVPPR